MAARFNRHYKLAGFSVERLMTLLTALDQGCRDRDSPKAALTKDWPNSCRCRLTLRWRTPVRRPWSPALRFRVFASSIPGRRPARGRV